MAPKRDKSKVEAYHDRVARIYDAIYSGRYWEFYDRLTWEHLKRYLPTAHGARVLDAGCGTGKWGLKLARSGFRVTFLDISARMLEEARDAYEGGRFPWAAAYVKADICAMEGLVDASVDLVVAQGDPLCSTEYPARAVREFFRVLAPGSVCVASVDSFGAALAHFVGAGDLEGLENFIKTGRTRWLAKKEGEDFSLQMFTPERLRKLFEAAGFEVLSLIGKPVLPLHAHQELLEDPASFRGLLAMEKDLWRSADLAVLAGHLQIAARKPLVSEEKS